MKKIGILTFHGTQNYGGVLQAYALQKYIKNVFSQNTKIIDFVVKEAPIFAKVRNWKDFILNGIILRYYPALKRKQKKFNIFRRQYMNLTGRYSSYHELQENPPDFDIFISGSDQVFCPTGKFVDVYFLEFLKNTDTKKIAYAPSFGLSYIPDDKKKRIAHLIKKFDSLSARELSGSEMIFDLTNKKAETVLDPVLLLNKKEWEEIQISPRKIAKPFILCYALVGQRQQMKIADKLKGLTGLPIVLLTHSVYPKINADIVVHDAGPQEFIWLFSQSDFVVTDSFHGTAFSILFEKPFFIHIAFPEKSNRILSLLKILSINDRIVRNGDEINKEMLMVDFEKIRENLENRKLISKEYLKEALNA